MSNQNADPISIHPSADGLT